MRDFALNTGRCDNRNCVADSLILCFILWFILCLYSSSLYFMAQFPFFHNKDYRNLNTNVRVYSVGCMWEQGAAFNCKIFQGLKFWVYRNLVPNLRIFPMWKAYQGCVYPWRNHLVQKWGFQVLKDFEGTCTNRNGNNFLINHVVDTKQIL